MSASRRLDGRIAVITGGAQGIGLGIATRLAEEGASVVLADIKQTEAERAAARLLASGLSAVALPVDIGQHESVKALAAEAPPSTLRIWPVTYCASSEQRKKAGPAMSAGLPKRRIGMRPYLT